MDIYDSPKEVDKRANQEDPIIMYLIVRKSLDMSIGKVAAQCAHASQKLLLLYINYKYDTIPYGGNPPFSKENYDLFNKWLDGSFRKVVLKANENQWKKLKEEFSYRERIIVIDNGLTEIEPGSETVIGLLPMRKSKAPKLVRKLRVL